VEKYVSSFAATGKNKEWESRNSLYRPGGLKNNIKRETR